MQLRVGAFLSDEKYRIEGILGQGGFGITYLAVQIGLNRKVAVKEFFMKDHCERDPVTSCVKIPSIGSRELVDRFRVKFLKEARTIAEMDNPHVIRIHDVFEENGTAYYVMEYLRGGSLSDIIPAGGLPESEAVGYIRQIAEALRYIHEEKHVLHLDVKPSNVHFRSDGELVLIDFGISKHYDEADDGQTSTTPVGASRGYAPLEQYKVGGLSQFTPATDIYSLGATLYKLLTGNTPADANDVNEDGLMSIPEKVSAPVRAVIWKSMRPRRKDRPQSIEEFLAVFSSPELVMNEIETEANSDDETVAYLASILSTTSALSSRRNRLTRWVLLVAIFLCVCTMILVFFIRNDQPSPSPLSDIGPMVDTLNQNSAPKTVEGRLDALLDSLANNDCLDYVRKWYDGLEGYDKYKVREYLCEKIEGKYVMGVEAQKFVDYLFTGLANGYRWVDLGLPSGLKWAEHNLGARFEKEPGAPYSWVDVKYHYQNDYASDEENDVTRSTWKGKWRTPTGDDWQELLDNCKWIYDHENNGFMIVSRRNGKSIFLPSNKKEYFYQDVFDSMEYWSSTEYVNSYSSSPIILYANSSGHKITLMTIGDDGESRAVRPVALID